MDRAAAYFRGKWSEERDTHVAIWAPTPLFPRFDTWPEARVANGAPVYHPFDLLRFASDCMNFGMVFEDRIIGNYGDWRLTLIGPLPYVRYLLWK